MTPLKPLDLRVWRGFLQTHASLWKRLEAELTRQHGLTLHAYDVLLTLEEAGEPGIRMTDLARRIALNAGALTRLIDRLQAEGCVVRRRCAHDARGFEAVLTPHGQQTLQRVHVTHHRLVHALYLDRLSEIDKALLTRVWETLLAPPAP